MASAGGQLRALNGLQSGSPRDLAIGIDASLSGEIDGPVCSVSIAGPRGALDRVAHNIQDCPTGTAAPFMIRPTTARSSLARQARDPVPNLSVKNVRVAVLQASD
jgi:hypothetical protein